MFSAADGVGVIALNRPQARNAIDPGFTEDLREAAERCAADEAVRAVLIRAEGPSFTVGGDVTAMARTPPAELPALLRRITATYHATLQLLDRLPVPVVTAVHGAVAGGGLGLVYVADIVPRRREHQVRRRVRRAGTVRRQRRHLVPAPPDRHAPGRRALPQPARPGREGSSGMGAYQPGRSG